MRLTFTLLAIILSHAWMCAFVSLRSQSLTTARGLSSNYVNDITEDRNGMLWLASAGGLTRLDGCNILNFHTFPTGDNGKKLSTAISSVTADKSRRYIWARSTSHRYFCYDTQTGRFADYCTGEEPDKVFREIAFSDNGTVWLYQGNGIRRCTVSYPEGPLEPAFHCTDYSKGQLPYREIRLLLPTNNGGAWLGSDNGLGFINARGKAVVIDRQRKVYQAMRMGGGLYAFFMKGNRILVGNENGRIVKDIAIPAQFGKINRITSYVLEAAGKGKTAVAHAFTNGGTLAVDAKRGSVRRSDKLNITEAKYYGTFNGYHVVITLGGEVYILDRNLNIVLSKKLLATVSSRSLRATYSVSAAKDSNIIIAARTWGMLDFNTKTGKATELHIPTMTPMAYYNVTKIWQDAKENLWVATLGDGVFTIPNQQELTATYIRNDSENLNSNSRNNFVVTMQPEADGTYTIATKTGGMYHYNPKDNSCTSALGKYSREMTQWMAQTNNYVTSVCTDAYGNTWNGMAYNAIFINGRHYKEKSYTINNLTMDRNGRIWFIENEIGLQMVRSAKDYGNTLKTVSFLETNAGEKNIFDIRLASDGRMWLGTGDGLRMVDTRQRNVTASSFKIFNSANSPVPGGSIFSIAADEKEHKIWCGMEAGGLAVYSFDKDWTKVTACEIYSVKQGLTSSTVNSLLLDRRRGVIWAGTDNGLSLVNIKTRHIKPYRFSPWSMDNFFTRNTMLMTNDGRVICGTGGGLLIIVPKSDLFSDGGGRDKNRPVFTDLMIDGESVFTNFKDDSFDDIRMGIINDGKVRLDHDQNNIVICVSNMGGAKTETPFQYYMEGLDETWGETTSETKIEFAHLSPGTYILHVRSLTGSHWSKEATLTIRITPPWYATWYAYLVYLCLATLLCRYIYKQARATYRLRKRLKTERMQREMEKKLTDYKVNFFTNVSHEFRTPLTIIKGATERIMTQNRQGDLKQPVDTLKRSTDRMLRLVNQLMEFRRMQQGRLGLRVKEEDIVTFIHNIFMDFHETAYSQGLDYHFYTNVKELAMPFDSNHLDKVMYNLISNAFKYSSSKGCIEVRLHSEGDHVSISVSDNGIGVDSDMQPHLFDNYMKSSRLVKDSLGIGLTLSAALIKRHHGTIDYKPNTPGGSIFTVTLPVSPSAYSAEEFMVESRLTDRETVTEKTGFEQAYREITEKPINDCTVLLAEDDADMAEYITQSLAKYFTVRTVKNGVEALNAMKEEGEHTPDIVVTDAMMPQMDGFQLTARLRKNDRFRNIPVIMLTALSQEEKHIKGITTGVDIYLNKPFNPNILVAHAIHLVNKYISMKRMTTEKRDTERADKQKTVVADIRDKNFMDQVDSIINAHISDENLSVETLTDGLGIGRSKLFEKMKQLCDMTPRDYILRHRMDYACQLLKDGSLSIAEIAYKTGFGHPPYFTRVFKKYYGVTPTEYIKGGN